VAGYCPEFGQFHYFWLRMDGKSVIFRALWFFNTIGSVRENLSALHKKVRSSVTPGEVRGMVPESMRWEGIEISPRFRRSMEERIRRLERDADFDESQLLRLTNGDHIRRQRKLVAAERAEALRMRLFLDKAGTRLPAPMIPL